MIAISQRFATEIKTIAAGMFHARLELQNFMTQIQSDPPANVASNLAASPPVQRRSFRFIFGTVLMAGSFMVYPTYPVILIWLPFSTSAKAATSVAVWILSWGTFSLGALLAGPEGYALFKALWLRFITGVWRRNPKVKNL
jgi:hypothetical protein